MKSASYGFYARSFHEVFSISVKGAGSPFTWCQKISSHVGFSQFFKWELILVLNLRHSQVY